MGEVLLKECRDSPLVWTTNNYRAKPYTRACAHIEQLAMWCGDVIEFGLHLHIHRACTLKLQCSPTTDGCLLCYPPHRTHLQCLVFCSAHPTPP